MLKSISLRVWLAIMLLELAWRWKCFKSSSFFKWTNYSCNENTIKPACTHPFRIRITYSHFDFSTPIIQYYHYRLSSAVEKTVPEEISLVLKLKYAKTAISSNNTYKFKRRSLTSRNNKQSLKNVRPLVQTAQCCLYNYQWSVPPSGETVNRHFEKVRSLSTV